VKIGDLVHMPGSIEPVRGVVLQTEPNDWRGRTQRTRVKVYWMGEAEVSWEPVKWLEVINPS